MIIFVYYMLDMSNLDEINEDVLEVDVISQAPQGFPQQIEGLLKSFLLLLIFLASSHFYVSVDAIWFNIDWASEDYYFYWEHTYV